MLFLFSKLFWTVAQPGNLLLLVLGCGVIRLLASGGRKGRGLVATVTFACFVVTVLPVGDWLVRPLENRFPAPRTLPARIDGIILLGGAVDTGITLAHGQVALDDAAERITATLALARQYPQARVLLSGGNGEMIPSGLAEATATRELLVSDGLDPGRITLETRSRNTIENAIFAKEIVQPRNGEVWLLVTSALHMPRAMGCFRHVGWEVVAYPVDYRTGTGWTPGAFDFAGRLGLLEQAAREWVGLVAYRLLGRIDVLFPAPRQG
jgi:uncharacterized SAM-binding protein YcdF (DUF218 family)